MDLSGPAWVARFPPSASIEDLEEPFRSSVQAFVAACMKAPIAITIAATRRPAARAWLMHWAWMIAREKASPLEVPARAGIDIQWAHTDKARFYDEAASRCGAEAMVQGYAIRYRPSLTSNHVEGRAIDMRLTWHGKTYVEAKDGVSYELGPCQPPRVDPVLVRVAASYGVKKLLKDPPHWSDDGH